MGAPRIQLFTYKTGLLAKLGDDLEFTLGGARLELDAARIHGLFQLSSLRVLGAIRRGCLDAHALDAKDKREIERIAGEILQSREHPEAILEAEVAAGAGDRFQVRGELTLRGQARPIEFQVQAGAILHASIELTPSRWGIAPHRAFGGALKLQDRVGVQVALPFDVPNFQDEAWRTVRAGWAIASPS
jgi:autotransporter translocation and assembly factor TamB